MPTTMPIIAPVLMPESFELSEIDEPADVDSDPELLGSVAFEAESWEDVNV
jgi:hypothetical protein